MVTLIIGVTGGGAISVAALAFTGSNASTATGAPGADTSTTGVGHRLGGAGAVNSARGAAGEGVRVGSGRTTSTTGAVDEGKLT